ncbi:MAG: hypothetical protein ACOC58_00335 [Chloroflexota bacterium]
MAFLLPILEVIEDRRVTTSEMGGLTQELLVMITVAVVMTAFWAIVEDALGVDLPW